MSKIISERQLSRLAVYVIFQNTKGETLFIRRYKTGWRDGEYTLPAGHIDPGETAFAAAVHEAREEVGLEIRENDLKLVHVMQHQGENESDSNYIDFYFKCENYSGEARIGEPNKADDLVWASPNKLREIPVIASLAAALSDIADGKNFSFWDYK